MSDLRATDAWRRLQTYIIRAGDVRLGPTWQEAMEALDALDPALIPEGAVLVTEETLARAFEHEYWTWIDAQRFAAAILRHLREGT